ncbi:MAG TPA: hypothetical protein ENJ70_02215 [Thermoplasmatales archaeon]|nr:hypothetical protein [Thermoplasmatales archaeon]
MIKMEEGFIVSNKIRKAIFLEVASGEKSLSRIMRKHHLIEHAARNAIEELEEHGLIEKKEDGYELTEDGIKIFNKLRELESL